MRRVPIKDAATVNPRMPRKFLDNAKATFVPMASVSKQGRIIDCQERPVSEVQKGFTYFERGDVIVAKITPCLQNGKAAYVDNIPHPVAFGSTEFHVLRPNDNVYGRYLFYMVWNPYFRTFAEAQFTGTGGQQRAPVSVFDRFHIPIPYADDPARSLSEQKRIADILDKADAIRRKQKETVSVAGKLVPAMFREVFGEPIANPHNWPTQTLGELLETIDSGWSPKCKDRPATDDEWGVLKLGAVTYCEYDDKENKALPSGVTERPNLEVKCGDLLFTRKNTYELVAASAIVRETRPKLMLPDLIFRLCIKKGVSLLPEYLWQLLIHPRKRAQIQTLAGGSSGSMPNISKQRLSTVVIPLPPRELQENFSKNLNACLDTRKRLANEAQTESNNLFNSLVQRAFKGEL